MLLRALEEKTFMPFGSDEEAHSDFQLIAGTNRDLFKAVREGKFREDLLARINLWTFLLPGLQDRPEDIEPNLNFELDQFAQKTGRRITFNKEARERFLAFALSSVASWGGNFRDLNAAVARMSTLASGGRISTDVVDEEISRLQFSWARPEENANHGRTRTLLGEEQYGELDEFDRAQLVRVIDVCARSRSLSDAGRTLFNNSRKQKSVANDADRLRKYLSRFGLDFKTVSESQA
jgi:transcriptional regulatory protein RtcR